MTTSRRGDQPRTLGHRLDLASQISRLGLQEREWAILEARLNSGLTLQRLADEMGNVTRERVRQIQKHAVEKIRSGLPNLRSALDALEARASHLPLGPDERGTDVGPIVSAVRAILRAAGWRHLRAQDVRQLITAIRALSDGKKRDAEVKWPRTSTVFCAVSPPVCRNASVAALVARRLDQSRKRSYKEIAQEVLKRAGAPMHWRDIAASAEKAGMRTSFTAAALYNALLGSQELFTRVGPGTYALSAWGLQPVDPYTDIIAAVMNKAERPLAYGELLFKVNEIRPIKNSSLQMFLEMHPRFYRSIDGTYGLRDWLPPRHEQTLRTPSRLVEPMDSYARLERAKERGYDVGGLAGVEGGSA